jgi:von Willebrand factor type A domain
VNFIDGIKNIRKNMVKNSKSIFIFLISIAFGFFLVFLSLDKAAIAKSTLSISESDKPLVIIIDNSGSMGRCSVSDSQNNCILDKETPYRIDIVKQIVSEKIKQMSSTSKIGLVEFGNYKEYNKINNSNKKPCEAVQILVKPVTGSRDKVLKYLQEIKANDDGVSPLGFSLRAVYNDILRDLTPAKILLISDGAPNCLPENKESMCDLFDGWSERKIDLKMHIIGYKVNPKDTEFINCAKRHPGMVSYEGSTENPKELEEKIDGVLPKDSWACIIPEFLRIIIAVFLLILAILFFFLASLAVFSVIFLMFPNNALLMKLTLIRNIVSLDKDNKTLLLGGTALSVASGSVAYWLLSLPCH